MTMTLHRMKIFRTIVEQQGFATAGAKLFLSQPSVSGQLKSFEKSLGVILIDREQSTQGNGIVLTEVGRFVFEATQRILSECETMLQYLKTQQDELSTIRVITNSTIGSYLLPKLVSNFCSANSDTKINLSIETDYNKLVKLCKSKLYDLCIAPLNTNILPNVNVVSSFKMQICLVTANDDFCTENKLSLTDLKKLPLILPPLNSVGRKAINAALPHLPFKNKASIELDHSESVKRALLSNDNHFALLSWITISEEARLGSLRVIQTDPRLPLIDYSILQLRNPLQNHVRHFLEYLENYLSLD